MCNADLEMRCTRQTVVMWASMAARRASSDINTVRHGHRACGMVGNRQTPRPTPRPAHCVICSVHSSQERTRARGSRVEVLSSAPFRNRPLLAWRGARIGNTNRTRKEGVVGLAWHNGAGALRRTRETMTVISVRSSRRANSARTCSPASLECDVAMQCCFSSSRCDYR